MRKGGGKYSEIRDEERPRYPEDLRYAKTRHGKEKKTAAVDKGKLEGRKYRKELLERFAEVDIGDYHELSSHQRYCERKECTYSYLNKQ